MTKTGVIGVLGTEATVRQPYVDDLGAKFAAEKTVLRHGSPGLVTGAEAKLRGEAVDPEVITRAIAGLRDQPGGDAIDVIVLACTHFPLLRDDLQAAAGPDVRLIVGAAGIARRFSHLTEGQPLPDEPVPGIAARSEEHTSEPHSLMRITNAGFCCNK